MPGGGARLIDEIERAGLRGRGGAGFPAATKLRTLAAGRRSIVIANGTEGEPASNKDKTLMAGSPHLVLDGLSIAAETIEASEAIICVDQAAAGALTAVTAALGERQQVGADQIPIRLEAIPSGYVSGEESAVVHWLNGGDAKPTFVPPRPYQRGVRGRPTLINNVETLAHLALIARFGADWYRQLGTVSDPGTALITLSGDLDRPGVFEIPFGVPLAEVLRASGGTSQPQAVLIGGYAGSWISGQTASQITLDGASLGRVKASLACGAITVVGPRSCGLRTVADVTRWMAGQSAGQCGPCAHGLPAIADAVDALVGGDRGHRWEKQLHRWLDMVEGRGACHHPDGTVRMVRSALTTFAAEIDNHRRHRACQAYPAALPSAAPKRSRR
jgi:NADH:ubiquinone oxidoreductase subunit F (NADH-binding)